MKPLAMTSTLAVACLHSKAQYLPRDGFEPHIAEGNLVSELEGWCDPFPGYYLYYPSRRQPSPALSLVVEALRYRSAGLGTARSNVAAKATGARRRTKAQ